MTDIEVKLNAWEQNYVPVLAVQGESEGRTIIATLIDRTGQMDGTFNAASIDRPINLTGVEARLYFVKPDGTKVFSDGTVTDATNGKVDFVLPYQATTAPGEVNCQILLTAANNPTAKIIGLTLNVQPSDLEGAAESTSEYSALATALSRVGPAVDDAQEAIGNANSALSTANTVIGNINSKESEITSAEQGRVTAESTRVSQENARKTAETTRQSQEGTRQSQESTRQTNETARGAAETTRSQNEGTRNGNEAARKTAEQDRAAAEADRQTHEADRRNAEDARVGAEQNRATAETARAAAETTRQQQETTRQTQETGRVNAESARVTAENKRQTDTQTAISGANTARDGANAAADRANTAAQNAEDAISGQLDPAIDARISAQKNQANGIAGLDGSGKVAAAQLPNMDYVPNSQKGTAGGVATLGDDGKVPAEQLSIPAPNYAGTLIVHVTSSDGGSVVGTRVRIRNEQLGANYVQTLDALGDTTFSLLDNHTYYLVLLDYPSQYYGAAASVSIAGGETQTLNLTLKTEPDIVGWRENVATGEIQYTDGAVNFQPMTVTDGVFDPGSWGESWLCDMRPCLLKAGVVQYYLQKTGTLTYDYSKQANGTPSDIVSGDDGDVMIEFPLTYYKTYTETDINNVSWLYWKFSKIPQDDTWCCNAWLSADGVPQEVFYMAAYDGFVYNNALRSLSGQTPTVSQTIGTFRTAANANGVGYEQQEWAKRAYVQSLLPMLFKGLDSQTLVGKGVSSASAKIDTGTMNDKPLFWGDQTGTIGVKFAGIENFWGNIYKFADGLINVSNAYKYKIYGPYNDTGSGYTSAGTIGGTNGQYIDTMQVANGYGMLPKTTVAAVADSKFHDYLWKSSSNTCICYTGGAWNHGATGGAFTLSLGTSADGSDYYLGASLSYTPV